ncbi:MAG: DUF2807 domain-containing protein [Pseudomonadota bacterium]
MSLSITSSRLSTVIALASAITGNLLGSAQAGETRRVDGLSFVDVLVVGDVDVEISQGDTPQLYLRGSEDDLDIEPFYLKGERLILGKNSRSKKADSVRYKIEMPSFREVELMGSGAAYIKEFDLPADIVEDTPTITVDGSGDIKLYGIRAPSLSLRVKGSGDLAAVSVDVEELEAIVAGSGDLYIKVLQALESSVVVTGSGDFGVSQPSYSEVVNLRLVGSGEAEMDEVSCKTAEIKVVGNGSVDLGEIAEALSVSILGSGDVRYSGKPTVEKSVIGSGDIRGRD